MRWLMLPVLLASVLLSACVNFGDNLAPQKTYMLAVPARQTPEKTLTKATLSVSEISAAAPYNMNSFIYRVSQSQYLSDYFHVFMVNPGEQMTDLFSRYFAGQGLFENVSTSGTQVLNPDYTLQARILDLYADYRDRTHPKAVLSLRVKLYYGQNHLLKLNHVFTAITPLSDKTNPALVKAWDADLLKILSQLSVRVRHVVLES